MEFVFYGHVIASLLIIVQRDSIPSPILSSQITRPFIINFRGSGGLSLGHLSVTSVGTRRSGFKLELCQINEKGFE